MQIGLVVITGDAVLAPCLHGLIRQKREFPDLTLLVNHRAPELFSPNPLIQKYENCHRNRNEARTKALASTADWFLFVDDDVVLPERALWHLVRQRQEVIGGYYPILGTNRYVCGRWVADNTFLNFTSVRPDVVETDTIGLGCALVSRRVLERVRFESGANSVCKDALTGGTMLVGECGLFGNRVAELGVPMYMCGDVVCDHLVRPAITREPAVPSRPQFPSSVETQPLLVAQ